MRARISMRWTITLFTGFFLAVSLTLMLTATLREAQSQWMFSSVLRARTAAAILSRTARHWLVTDDMATLDRMVHQVAGEEVTQRVVVLGRGGRILADNAPEAGLPPLLQGASVTHIAERVSVAREHIDVLMPIPHRGTVLGAVFLRYSVREHLHMLDATRDRGIVIGLLVVLGACLIVYCLAGVVSTPIRRLAGSMESVAQGNLGERLSEEGCQEIRQMAQSFNHMAGSLRSRVLEMDSLRALGAAVSRSLNLGRVAQAAIESVESTLPDTRIGIWVRDSEGACLVEARPSDVPEAQPHFIPLSGDSVLALAIQEKRAVLAGGPQGERPIEAWFREGYGACAMAAVPLSSDAAPVGVLVALRCGPGAPLLADDLHFLSAAASQISTAIENAGRFTRERRLASLLRHLLVPSAPAAVPGLDIAAHWLPAPGDDKVGGDYYDFIPLPDGTWGIVIGDVCGKGVVAASYTAIARYVLRSYAYESASPAEILQRTNAALYAQMNAPDSGEEAPMFVTIFCALYDPATGRLTYSHAGHPLATLVRAGTTPAVTLDSGGPPVGVLSNATYKEGLVYLAPGDVLALYTDGVVEAAGGGGHYLEGPRIAQLLAAHRDEPVQSAADALMHEVARLARGTVTDDVTLVVLRARGDVSPFVLPGAQAELAAG